MPTLTLWKDAFTANTLTENTQFNPDVTSLSNGNMLVVWGDANDITAGGAGYDIVGQLYNPMGVAIGDPIFLNDGYGAGRSESVPEVVATADGGFIVSYSYYGNTEYDQLFRRFDADGNATQQNYVVNDAPAGTTYTDFDMVHRPDGTTVVTYRRDTGADEDLMYRVIGTDGRVSGETEVRYDQDPSGNTQGDPDNPRSAVLEDGRVIVAFQEEDNNIYGPEYSVINTNGSVSMRGNVVPATTRADDVDVAGLKGGGFVITWREGNVIKGQIYDDSPVPVRQGGVLTLAGDSDVKDAARVVGLKDGGFAVTWIDRSDNEISTRLFDGTGAMDSNKKDIALGDTAAYDLEAELSADGRLMLTWASRTTEPAKDYNIASAILDPRPEAFDVTDGTPTTASKAGSDITGSAADDLFYGMGRADELSGLGGDDTLFGGNGDDELSGGAGQDRLFGGRGDDEIKGGHDDDRIWGSDGEDAIWGSLGDDVAWAGRDDDRMWGQSGDDRFYGAAGNDAMYGGSGADKLIGGKGADMIVGGTGADIMVGGTGRDSFVFKSLNDSRPGSANRDEIRDFTHNRDTIDLAAIDADTTRGGNQAFEFIGFDSFDDAGDLRLKKAGNDVFVQGDVNGDGRADFEIKLADPGFIDQFDFIL